MNNVSVFKGAAEKSMGLLYREAGGTMVNAVLNYIFGGDRLRITTEDHLLFKSSARRNLAQGWKNFPDLSSFIIAP